NNAIGILNQLSGQEAFREAFLKDVHRLQQAVFSIRAEAVSLSPESTARPDQFTARNYPVVVSIDPLGEYLHTLHESADAAQAMRRYVEEGGVLIALSRGG